MAETILGAPLSEEHKKELEAQNLDWQRFCILLGICYEFYISDESKNDLAGFCKLIVTIREDFEGEHYQSMADRGCDRLIGELVIKAVKHDGVSGKQKVSNRNVFRKLVAGLVEMSNEDGHSKNKTEQTFRQTAFGFTADLLYKYGITNKGRKFSESTISNWCDEVK